MQRTLSESDQAKSLLAQHSLSCSLGGHAQHGPEVLPGEARLTRPAEQPRPGEQFADLPVRGATQLVGRPELGQRRFRKFFVNRFGQDGYSSANVLVDILFPPHDVDPIERPQT